MTRFGVCAQKHPPITHTRRHLGRLVDAKWEICLLEGHFARNPGQPARPPHGNQLDQWKITNNPHGLVWEDYGNRKGNSRMS